MLDLDPTGAVAAPTPTPDLAELFRVFAPRVERIVRGSAGTSEPVVEDACQAAWSRLLGRDAPVAAERIVPWLSTTAIREARRLALRDEREPSVDVMLDEPLTPAETLRLAATGADPHELVEQRDRLALHVLPDRQRRIVWMKALGFSYTEISRATGCTPRTVERQLLRARDRLGAWTSGTQTPRSG